MNAARGRNTHVRVATCLLFVESIVALQIACSSTDAPHEDDSGSTPAEEAGKGTADASFDGKPSSVDAGFDAARFDATGSDTSAGDATFPTPFDVSGLPNATPYGHVLYLNFSGAALAFDPTSDGARNTSWIRTDQANTVVPAFFEDLALDPTLATRADLEADIVNKVAEAYAPFDVQVVSRRPAIDTFAMIVVGGRNADLGRPIGSYGVGSPNGPLGACGFSPHATAFVTSSDWVGSLAVADPRRELVHVAVHEAAHLFGLVHTASGGTMDPNGSVGWTNGPSVLDNANPCGRTQQDDVAILTANLGAHQPRPVVPVASDQTPPQLSVVAPVAALSSGKSVVGCVTVSDSSPIQYVMRQVLLKAKSEFLVKQDVLFAPPYTFPPVDVGTGVIVRFLAVDRWDNVAEQRVVVHLDPAAPPQPPCP